MTLRPTFLAALAAFFVPAALSAQADSTTVVAGEEYRAGSIRRLLWGPNYRHLWTRPIRVEVLDPDTFAGGLTPLRAGGDFASNTLHMIGADGRRFVFRSINKDVSQGLGEEFAGTIIEWVVQDQVSASHPAAPLLAAPLLEAAGILHAEPRLVVMADAPSLGQFRERFAGMLGAIEERADENDPPEDDEERAEALEDGVPPEMLSLDGPAFAGADVVKGTEEFLDDLEDSPTNRLHSREYLAARLMDLLMGDWDRHEDQWRWARFDRGDLRVWRPVPRDRDNAFVSHQGLMLSLGRRIFPRMVRFDPDFPSLTGLTLQAEPLDRRLLSDLPRAAWDSVAASLRARLTDRAIANAVANLPTEYRADGADIAARLRSRREQLPAFASAFYDRLAINVDIHATDRDEVVTVDRREDGSIDVRIVGTGDPEERWVTFERRFVPDETDDVRIYLHGGDDRVTVRGTGHGVGVRVIGGGGDDVLADSSNSSGVAFYDDRGDNRFVRGPGTRVSEEAWTAPVDTSSITGRRTYRDWGSSTSFFSPWVGWARGAGPVIGGGPRQTAYGFRRNPRAWSFWLRGGWAPLENRFELVFEGDLYPENAHRWYTARATATDLENVRFFGFGNETTNEQLRETYDTWLRQLSASVAVNVPFTREAVLSAGPIVKWTDPEVEAGSPLDLLRPIGAGALGQAGAFAEAEIDRRDLATFPRRGFRLRAGGSGYPAVWDGDGAFGEAHASASAYLSAGRGPVLALRAGGKQVWGDFPFHEAAFLGGQSTLRGHTGQRFAGDAMVFGGAEARVPLIPLNIGVRGTFGVLALADAGRVWFDGDSPGEWHTAYGGGAFFHALGQTATVTIAQGERTSINFGLGVPF